MRFQLTPAPTWFEALARRLYRRHENRLVRAEHWGLREGGLTSTLNRAEMRNAEQTQNRSLFWLELTIAADSAHACKTLAAAVQARRGENRLHRRYMLVRRNLYRRRFPHALAAAPALPARARLRRRGRAPARTALRAHEGRPRAPRHRPAHPRAARGAARRRPRPDRRARRADARQVSAPSAEPTATAA